MLVFRCAQCGKMNRVPEERAGARGKCGSCKEPLDASGKPQPVTGQGLSETIASSPVPVLVDFWAAWCAPCRMAAPIFEEIGHRQAGKLNVLKLDTDAEQAAAREHRIQGIPTFILFQGGREVARRSGVTPRAELEAWVASSTR